MTPLVSIIVPVYKVEAYIQECIDSILSQDFTNFELILVNDGSPDNCGAICDANAAKDSRIRVIHQENQGVTRARANGVTAARGEFISFVDGDDMLLPHALEVLIEPIAPDIDIILGKFAGYACPSAGAICKEEFQKMSAIMTAYHVGPIAKLYRTTLFGNDVFDLPRELRMGEDAVMNIRLAYKMKGKAYSTDTVIYMYRSNPDSTTHVLRRTPESDAMLQKYRLGSIPPDDVLRFLPCGLADNLILFWMSSTCQSKTIPASTREHHRYLLSVRKYSTLKLGIYPTILFYCTNTFLRSIVIGARNLFHRVVKRKSR